MGKKRLLPALCLSLICLSCSYFGPEQEIVLVLPDLPEPWKESFSALPFSVCFPGRQGSIERYLANADSCELALSVLKGACIPVTAYPLLGEIALLPAGALFSLDLAEDGRLLLSWDQGFTASLLLDIFAAGVEIETINTDRLSLEIVDRTSNPWTLDRNAICGALLGGEFRVTDLKFLPVVDCLLVVGDGFWLTENPHTPLFEADTEGTITLPLTWGYHRIFSCSSPVQYEVQVGPEEILIKQSTYTRQQ